MPVSSELEKQIKKATKTGKYVVGRKEVLSSMKGSKLLVWSASANLSPDLLEQCKSLQIPAIRFDGDPIALGKMCGIPFKVSVIAVRSAGDADLGSFSDSHDYSLTASGAIASVAQSTTVAQSKKEVSKALEEEPKAKEEKPKKTRKKKKSEE